MWTRDTYRNQWTGFQNDDLSEIAEPANGDIAVKYNSENGTTANPIPYIYDKDNSNWLEIQG